MLLLEAGPDLRAAEVPPSISGPSFVAAMGEPGQRLGVGGELGDGLGGVVEVEPS